MNFIEFINKYLGKKVDFDGAFGAQCVDLFRQYVKEVLEIREHTGAVEGARDLYINYSKMPLEQKNFTTENTITARYGDVAVWDRTATNRYGHVAIFLCWVNADKMLVFEQDGCRQDGAKLALRDKNNCLGLLRRRK